MEKILLSWICIVETEENENCFFNSTSLRKKKIIFLVFFSRFLNFWHLTWLFSRESYFVHSKGSKALALTFIWDTLYKNIIRGFSWRFFVRSPLRSTSVCPFVWCLSDFSYQVLGRKSLTNQEDLKNCSCCPLIFVHGGNDESTISFDDSN